MHAGIIDRIVICCGIIKHLHKHLATFWASRHFRVQPAWRTAAGVVFVLCLRKDAAFCAAQRRLSRCLASSLPGPPLPVRALLHRSWHLTERSRPGRALLEVLATAYLSHSARDNYLTKRATLLAVLESSLRRASSDASQASRASASLQAAFAHSTSRNASSAAFMNSRSEPPHARRRPELVRHEQQSHALDPPHPRLVQGQSRCALGVHS